MSGGDCDIWRGITRVGLGLAVVLSATLSGCGLGLAGDAGDGSVFVSVINVTPYDASLVISGVRGDLVDTAERTVAGSGSTDVTFVCVDELVLGDPLNPAVAAVIVDPGGVAEPIPPFSISADVAFFCGDIVEFVISGHDAATFAVDVFAFAPP